MNKKLFTAAALVALAVNVRAWDYEGHHAVNELALAALPKDFPAFILEPAARDRIAFLAGEADRWRNVTDFKTERGLELGHCSGPDHYLDLEEISEYGLTPATLSPFRYVFVADIAKVSRLTGWQPQVSAPAGVARMLQWVESCVPVHGAQSSA